MKDNKLIKFLIPLVAAVVVFESILLVNNLEKSNNKIKVDDVKNEQVVEEVVEKEEPVVSFSFDPDISTEMKVGKTYKVSLVLKPEDDRVIDAIETHIKYDPMSLKISGLIPNKKLVSPIISKINSEAGIVSNIYLIEDKTGLSLTSEKELNILTFSVTPQSEGVFTLDLNTGEQNKTHETLVMETGTAKSLGWTGGKLEINVTK